MPQELQNPLHLPREGQRQICKYTLWVCRQPGEAPGLMQRLPSLHWRRLAPEAAAADVEAGLVLPVLPAAVEEGSDFSGGSSSSEVPHSLDTLDISSNRPAP